MRRYIFFILSLFLMLPACAQSEHYQERVAQFAAMRDVDSTDIVMLGNALTEYAGDWNVLLSWRHVRNRGIAGDDAEGMYRRIGSVLKGRPKAIFLMTGGQDIIEGKTVDEAFNASVALIAHIRAQRQDADDGSTQCAPPSLLRKKSYRIHQSLP